MEPPLPGPSAGLRRQGGCLSSNELSRSNWGRGLRALQAAAKSGWPGPPPSPLFRHVRWWPTRLTGAEGGSSVGAPLPPGGPRALQHPPAPGPPRRHRGPGLLQGRPPGRGCGPGAWGSDRLRDHPDTSLRVSVWLGSREATARAVREPHRGPLHVAGGGPEAEGGRHFTTSPPPPGPAALSDPRPWLQ